MKKLLLLLAITLTLSCSKDDVEDGGQLDNDYYTFYYTDGCYNPYIGSMCLTIQEYETAMQTPYYIDNVCFSLRIDNEFYIFSSAMLGCIN